MQKRDQPKPTKENSLLRLKDNVPITSIVDVGVREKTSELITVFPEIKHYLFEPCNTFFPEININYKNINSSLYNMALSDANSNIYLVTSSLEKNGVATHSEIAEKYVTVDGIYLLSCDPVDVKRFDELPLAQRIEGNFLLKVDVDGKDLNVVMGFGAELKKASVVIIECTTNNMIERMSYIESKGFKIVDMVDMVYYGESLYQFDAVFVRSDLINKKIKPTFDVFDKELWHPI